MLGLSCENATVGKNGLMAPLQHHGNLVYEGFKGSPQLGLPYLKLYLKDNETSSGMYSFDQAFVSVRH